MKTQYTIEQITQCIARAQSEGLPLEVIERLGWILEYAHTHSVSSTCRRFGIARTTLYRWMGRFDPSNLCTLESEPTIVPHSAIDRVNHDVLDAVSSMECREWRDFFVLLRLLSLRFASFFWNRYRVFLFTSSVLLNVATLLALLLATHWEMRRVKDSPEASHAASPQTSHTLP